MNACPRDAARLTTHRVHEYNVARCSTCSGLWIPAHVVGITIGRITLPSSKHSATPLQCPDDANQLLALRHRGVEIDLCHACGGVWLDAGELERILRRKSASVITHRGGRILDAIDAGTIVFDCGDLLGAVIEFVLEALSGL